MARACGVVLSWHNNGTFPFSHRSIIETVSPRGGQGHRNKQGSNPPGEEKSSRTSY